MSFAALTGAASTTDLPEPEPEDQEPAPADPGPTIADIFPADYVDPFIGHETRFYAVWLVHGQPTLRAGVWSGPGLLIRDVLMQLVPPGVGRDIRARRFECEAVARVAFLSECQGYGISPEVIHRVHIDGDMKQLLSTLFLDS